MNDETLPPWMLPLSDGPASVIVCVGDCGNEPQCPMCVAINPDDPEWEAAFDKQ